MAFIVRFFNDFMKVGHELTQWLTSRPIVSPDERSTITRIRLSIVRVLDRIDFHHRRAHMMESARDPPTPAPPPDLCDTCRYSVDRDRARSTPPRGFGPLICHVQIQSISQKKSHTLGRLEATIGMRDTPSHACAIPGMSSETRGECRM